MKSTYDILIKSIQTFFKNKPFKSAVIGLSGGLDSSLTLKLAVDALGKEKVYGVLLPELQVTSPENIEHAKALASFFEIKTFYQPINPFLIDFKDLPWHPTLTATMNTKARVRAVLLYSVANTFNGVVLGTSNKSELTVGYGTKYGDLAADCYVIGDLYKTKVVALSEHLGLPPEIVNKPPTAELFIGQTDAEELGADYPLLDNILQKFEKGMTTEEITEKGLDTVLVHKIWRRIQEHEHKRKTPPIFTLKKKSKKSKITKDLLEGIPNSSGLIKKQYDPLIEEFPQIIIDKRQQSLL